MAEEGFVRMDADPFGTETPGQVTPSPDDSTMISQIAVDTAKVVTPALSLDHVDTMVRPRPDPRSMRMMEVWRQRKRRR